MDQALPPRRFALRGVKGQTNTLRAEEGPGDEARAGLSHNITPVFRKSSLVLLRAVNCAVGYVVRVGSLGPRPSPLRDLLRAFNCAGEGNIENGEGLAPGMKHHVPIDATGRARPVASTANMYTLASVRLLSFWLTANM